MGGRRSARRILILFATALLGLGAVCGGFGKTFSIPELVLTL
jgi:hypothetical protein